MTRETTSRSAALIAAAGLSALSPIHTGAALLTAGTALWASPALAQTNNVPGVGTVVKKKPGDSPILAPSDANGEVRITGLEPGVYEVAPLPSAADETSIKQGHHAVPNVRFVTLRVGQDGRLAFAACCIVKDIGKPPRYLAAIPFDGTGGKLSANAVTFDMQQAFRTNMPPPCDPIRGRPDTCNRTPQRNHIDVNASSAAEIVRLAPETSPAAAEALIAERTRGGAFKNVKDFASRVCTKTSIAFGDMPVRMGNASILVKRGDNPKAPGFKCKTGDNMFLLYTAWFSNSGRDLAGWRDPFEICGVGEDSRPD